MLCVQLRESTDQMRASQQRECEAFVRARTLSRSHVHVMVNHPAEGEVMHLAQV